MSTVFLCLLVCLSPLQTVAARRSQGTCSTSGLACDKVKDFLKVEQPKGNCRPFAPRFIVCEAGLAPGDNAFRFALPDFSTEPEGQRCRKRYKARQCKYTNDRMVSDGAKSAKLKAMDGGKCEDAELTIRDCEDFMTTLAAHDVAKSSGTSDAQSLAFDLTKAIAALQRQGPNEYYWLPGFPHAIEKLSDAVVKAMEEDTSDTARASLVEPTNALLLYCEGTKAREKYLNDQLEYDQLDDDAVLANGLKACKEVNKMDIIFGSHPWKKDLETDVDTITALHHFEKMNIQFLDKGLWAELLEFASPPVKVQMQAAYEKLAKKFAELIVTAGDRGETELELALQYSFLPFSGGAKPEGGQTRLDIMSSFRKLKNTLASSFVTEEKLNEAMEEVRRAVQKDPSWKWVDSDQLNAYLEQAAETVKKLKSGEPVAPVAPPAFMHTTTTSTTRPIVIATTTTTTTVLSEVELEVEVDTDEDDESDAEEDGDSFAWVWHSVQTTWQEKADKPPISTRRSSVIAVPLK